MPPRPDPSLYCGSRELSGRTAISPQRSGQPWLNAASPAQAIRSSHTLGGRRAWRSDPLGNAHLPSWAPWTATPRHAAPRGWNARVQPSQSCTQVSFGTRPIRASTGGPSELLPWRPRWNRTGQVDSSPVECGLIGTGQIRHLHSPAATTRPVRVGPPVRGPVLRLGCAFGAGWACAADPAGRAG